MHGRVGAQMGSDAAGIVEKVGPGVDESYVGKTVALLKIEGGAWAEYVLINPNKTDYMIILPSSASAAGGASLPIPVLTIFSTFIKLGLPPLGQLKGKKPGAGQWMLIWSASTAVGLCVIPAYSFKPGVSLADTHLCSNRVAVQLAKIYGFKVVATASPKKHDIVKAYGADSVLDYRVSPEGLA
jgi:NADPH:quinone reductase-like Zn-dependent oxidoreductase